MENKITKELENYQAVNAIRWETQQRFVTILKDFVKAVNEDIKAEAVFDAFSAMTYQGFLEKCISNARSNDATWPGGAHSSGNVIEAIVREAWLNASSDMEIRILFPF